MIRRQLSSSKGAASIMVIMLLVVLLVFGVAALTTALSGMRLGQKVEDWNKAFYTAEGEANEKFAQIDKAVSDAFTQNGDAAQSITESIEALGFATVRQEGEVLIISYETWSDSIGISAELELDTEETRSLKVIQWMEIQK